MRYLPVRSGLTTAAVVGLAAVLAACGSSSGGSPASSATGAAPASGSRPVGGGGGRGGNGGPGEGFAPGTFGKVAAVSGTTMQVQGAQAQTAVSWTTATAFTHQVTTSVSALKAGDCVTAIGASGTSGTAAAFTAASITLTPSTNGSCSGFGGGNRTGARPAGAPTGRPTNRPTGTRPSGGRNGAANIAVASGTVKAVSGSTITVAARAFRPGGGASSSTAKPATTTKTITVGSSTRLTTTARTTASSVKVGVCVTANGKSDSSGAVAATRVQISSPVKGQCTGGLGRRGNGR